MALDIGTEYVKALIGQVVECKDEKTGKREQVVEIIGSGRQRQRLTDMSSGAITYIAGVVENCDAALRRAEEMAGTVAKDAVLGIAGELVKGGTTTVSYRRAKPDIKIDQAELMDIIERIQKQCARDDAAQSDDRDDQEQGDELIIRHAKRREQADGAICLF